MKELEHIWLSIEKVILGAERFGELTHFSNMFG